MFKKVVLTLFLLFSSYTVLATSFDFDRVDAQTKQKAMSPKLNQVDSKFIFSHSTKASTSNEEVVNLSDQKTEKKFNRPEPDSNDQTGWLLVFALLGFVMLSNRRGV